MFTLTISTVLGCLVQDVFSQRIPFLLPLGGCKVMDQSAYHRTDDRLRPRLTFSHNSLVFTSRVQPKVQRRSL
uniref:Putative secreted protein n=1 Tax=Anopheles darlingi TaxID=43151 RepID=A0A2M4DJZ3_ANODA